MDDKNQNILADEIRMIDAIPAELKTGSVFALEYMRYISELNSELRLTFNQVGRGALTADDINLMCRDMLLKNVWIRRRKTFWIFSWTTKTEMTKNRLRYMFLTFLEASMHGNTIAGRAVQEWLDVPPS